MLFSPTLPENDCGDFYSRLLTALTPVLPTQMNECRIYPRALALLAECDHVAINALATYTECPISSSMDDLLALAIPS